MGTSPPQLFGRIATWSQRLWCVSLMRCTVWLLASERLVSKTQMPDSVQWQKKPVHFGSDGTGAYNADGDNVVFECEGSRVSRFLGTELMY